MNTPVVLITGALTGIGRATALAFAHEGARVVISGRREEAGNKLVAELREIGAEAEYWRADLRHEDDVRDLVSKTVTRFGRLDVASTTPALRASPAVTEQSAGSWPPSAPACSARC
jgi:NAD(P)-dependent dehydrogenase (short-subunit alcohol dehydrogenase family)